jgi:hypothetical protein
LHSSIPPGTRSLRRSSGTTTCPERCCTSPRRTAPASRVCRQGNCTRRYRRCTTSLRPRCTSQQHTWPSEGLGTTARTQAREVTGTARGDRVMATTWQVQRTKTSGKWQRGNRCRGVNSETSDE